ncbi:uncharacterized protein LOC128272537 [Anopheles cruzii]|uniref:uncharacterized protein LOC128272537 n=1 Tax=Anopheles cruzii TaxID=68878 RepID=UPI0022EC3CAE|nr:uncharacterized protein LOC128272537 [Anopheles cruzii]
MWSKLFLATLLLGLTLADKQNATEPSAAVAANAAKEKRQTEHETRSIPLSVIGGRRQQQQHQPQEYYQSEEAAAQYAQYAQASAGQPTYKASAAGHKASQEQPQYQEIPPEYISLLHQLAEHQPKAAAVKQGKAVAHHQQQLQHQHQQQQHQQQQQQQQQYEHPSHAQQPNQNHIQYITEEEYAQLVKQAQQLPSPAGPQAYHPHYHHQHHQPQQPQGLQAYGRAPAHAPAQHKYRPAIQLLETSEDQPGPYGAADGEQYRIQYKSIQQSGTVTPVPKPVSSFSFEKELAKLVESNRPLPYRQLAHPHPAHHEAQHEAQRYGPTPSPQSHEYTYVQAGGPAHDHGGAPQQPPKHAKAQYVASFAQGHPLAGPKISPAHLQVGPQKFSDIPAQKYQFIGNPEAHHHPQHHHQAPAHQGQQYFAEVSPKQHPGTPSPKIQYYVPKEKNVQVYYQQQQQQQQQQQHHQHQQQLKEQQALEEHSPQHPMKIVEAPQLQHEKPQKTVQSVHRPRPAEQQQVQHRYAPREKQQDQPSPVSSDPHAPSRSSIYVSQSTGVNQATAAATPAPAAHYGEKHHKVPPKIDRPLTPEEFQALVDAGYSVVPVPVPVPVPISQYQAQQAALAAGGHPGQRGGPHPTPSSGGRQVAQASRYHLHQLAAAENNPNQVVTYLRPLHLDPFSAGVRGPHKAAP